MPKYVNFSVKCKNTQDLLIKEELSKRKRSLSIVSTQYTGLNLAAIQISKITPGFINEVYAATPTLYFLHYFNKFNIKQSKIKVRIS